MKDFSSYQKDLFGYARHKTDNSLHKMGKEDFMDFSGFCEEEIWGVFADFDYENWLKEQ